MCGGISRGPGWVTGELLVWSSLGGSGSYHGAVNIGGGYVDDIGGWQGLVEGQKTFSWLSPYW